MHSQPVQCQHPGSVFQDMSSFLTDNEKALISPWALPIQRSSLCARRKNIFNIFLPLLLFYLFFCPYYSTIYTLRVKVIQSTCLKFYIKKERAIFKPFYKIVIIELMNSKPLLNIHYKINNISNSLFAVVTFSVKRLLKGTIWKKVESRLYTSQGSYLFPNLLLYTLLLFYLYSHIIFLSSKKRELYPKNS